MDKNNYESYEYLPANDGENDQLFVVQDNGTFVISRQAVQFTAQGSNVKEPLETVQVYNVTPQQFLVNVDNSSELISVSDQFIIPDGANNLYENSFLLQPEASASVEPMEQDPNQDVAEELKQSDSHMVLGIGDQTNKQSGSCTEITLTDEQYQMLEQKGWILLEISDKIYILDSLGLHDITTNQKLIEKLKTEDNNNDNQEIDNGSKGDNAAFDDTTQEIPLQSSLCVIENNIVIEQPIEAPPFKINNEEDSPSYNEIDSVTSNVIAAAIKADANNEQREEDIETNARVLVIENEDIRRVGNTLKVKTKLSLKDFPEKIVLGKTVNGKNLIAKVVKPTNSDDSELPNTDHDKPDDNSQTGNDATPAIRLQNSNLLNESEFYLLMQHFFQNNLTKCNAEDVVTADSIISQLLQIPSFKTSVLDNNLVITKTVQNEDSSGKTVNKGLSALVTGRVSFIADHLRFVHLPHMLQDMVTKTDEFLSKYTNVEGGKKADLEILHVQISEAKQTATDVVRVSVTVNKRNIPLHLITNKTKQQPSTMYACSFCAALFDTEQELKAHQMDNCMKQEEMLTIDMDPVMKPRDFCIINSGKTKTFACMQCNSKFSRLTACKNHLKTHYSPKHENAEEQPQAKKSSALGIYKCNMCPSTYFHPSTLSKHILARHIKISN